MEVRGNVLVWPNWSLVALDRSGININYPTVRTVRARLGETDHAFTLEIADEDGQWHPNWQFNPRSLLNRATAPDLSKRGNQVSVERRLGGFLARTNGRVMGSAKAGETVQVRLDDGVIRHAFHVYCEDPCVELCSRCCSRGWFCDLVVSVFSVGSCCSCSVVWLCVVGCACFSVRLGSCDCVCSGAVV